MPGRQRKSRHLIVHMKGKRNRHFGPDKVAVLHEWFSESVTGFLSTIGRIAALAVSSRSSRRSYCVRQVGVLTSGRAYGIPGDPGRSVGTASNLEDALAIHRGEH